MSKIKEKIKEEILEVKNEIRERTVGYILTALGLVAGLAWNDAIKSFIEYVFPPDHEGNTLKAKFVYAVLITIIIVIVSAYLARLSHKNRNGKDEEKAKVSEEKKKK